MDIVYVNNTFVITSEIDQFNCISLLNIRNINTAPKEIYNLTTIIDLIIAGLNINRNIANFRRIELYSNSILGCNTVNTIDVDTITTILKIKSCMCVIYEGFTFSNFLLGLRNFSKDYLMNMNVEYSFAPNIYSFSAYRKLT